MTGGGGAIGKARGAGPRLTMALVSSIKLAGGAAAALAVVALAGCGSTPAHRSGGAVASRALDAATSSALSSSFKANVSGWVRLGLEKVSGLPSTTQEQLTRLQQQLNSSTLVGSLEFQSPADFEGSYSFAPALPAPVDVIEVGGVRYVSVNGAGWHEVPATPPGGKAARWSGGMAPALGSLAGLVRSASAVSTLPPTSLDGQVVDHLQARIPGAALARILTRALSSGAVRGGGADIQALVSLLNFQPATLDSFIAKSTGLPVRESARGGFSFNLAALGLLGSAGVPQARGTVALTFEFTVTFSGYGSHFAITKPSQLVPGPPPAPGSPALSSLF